MQRQAEIACPIAQTACATVLRIQCDTKGNFLTVSSSTYAAPTVLRNDYATLKAETEGQMKRNKEK
jgi:hypothetical protein